MAEDLNAAVRIFDTSASLVLDITEANGYELVMVSNPDRTWWRLTTHSAFADGEFPIAMRLEQGSYGLVILVKGATQAQIATRIKTLVDAVEAWSWLLEVTIGNSRVLWRATRADSSNPLDKYQAMAGQTTITVTIPVQPTPSSIGEPDAPPPAGPPPADPPADPPAPIAGATYPSTGTFAPFYPGA